MKILTDLEVNQISFIPRKGCPLSVMIRDEQTKEETEYIPTFTYEDYHTKFILTHTLVENRKYSVHIQDEDGMTLYRDLMQAITDQPIETYSINKDEYDIPEEVVESTPIYKII
tara:strand:+ start:633 stop:974 length:342 start_codon:yes stop_codon:yes gene_type:complete